MSLLGKDIRRICSLALAVIGFCLVRPEWFAQGPDLCLWRWLFDLPACPTCGSTRALAAFFHGEFRQALAFNPNVMVTAPGLLTLIAWDAHRLLQKGSALRR